MIERIVFACGALALAGCCFGGVTIPGMPGPTGSAPAPVGTAGPVGGVVPVTLAPGFLPDPQVGTGAAGGPIAAHTMSPQCRGYIATTPNHVLNVTGHFTNLRIVVSSPADTTLVVQRADGTLACNDDSDGLDPAMAGPFGPGQHRVWVGTYGAAQSGTPYTIAFTELGHVTAASLGAGMPGLPTGAGAGIGALVPPDCGMAVPLYGPVAVGSSVVLGIHSPWTGSDGQGGVVTGDTNWAPEMAQFVGQRTTVTELGGLDTAGCPGVRVQADQGQFFWRIRNVAL